MKAQLGKEYKDSISGYQGIAVARSTYLYGCVRIQLQSTKLNKDSEIPDGYWFDEPQLQKVRVSKKVNTRGQGDGPAGPARSVAPSKDPV